MCGIVGYIGEKPVYDILINGLKKLEIGLDRKMLADLAMHEPNAFKHLVEKVQSAAK